MDKKLKLAKEKEKLMRDLKPSSSYLDSPPMGFIHLERDLISALGQAENAANELINETAPNAPKISAKNEPSKPDIAKDAAENTGETIKENTPSLEQLLARLDELVGLEEIKQSVKSLINLVKARKLREENDLPNPPISLHMVFTGNPGTGKTTVARILSALYRTIGVLSKGQLIEVDRSGLVAGFVGQTAIKTAEVVTSALGGILFIDEAYSLAPEVGTGNDFGREAIETLLKMMEDNRDDLIVIVAGYSEQMERFIMSNPGLESRFNRYFAFDDYNGEELEQIFNALC